MLRFEVYNSQYHYGAVILSVYIPYFHDWLIFRFRSANILNMQFQRQNYDQSTDLDCKFIIEKVNEFFFYKR